MSRNQAYVMSEKPGDKPRLLICVSEAMVLLGRSMQWQCAASSNSSNCNISNWLVMMRADAVPEVQGGCL